MRTLVTVLVGSTVVAVANWFGWWQATFVVGGACALLAVSGKRGIWTSLVTGALGWGAPLLALSQSAHLVDLAGVLGRVVGIGDGGAMLMLLVPSLFGALLSLMASWIVTAIKGVVQRTAIR